MEVEHVPLNDLLPLENRRVSTSIKLQYIQFFIQLFLQYIQECIDTVYPILYPVTFVSLAQTIRLDQVHQTIQQTIPEHRDGDGLLFL